MTESKASGKCHCHQLLTTKAPQTTERACQAIEQNLLPLEKAVDLSAVADCHTLLQPTRLKFLPPEVAFSLYRLGIQRRFGVRFLSTVRLLRQAPVRVAVSGWAG